MSPQHSEMVAGFSHVDEAGDPSYFVRFLANRGMDDRYYRNIAPILHLLDLQPGHRVLDLACGIGNEARLFAPQVEPGGEVVGVDFSALMIAEASRRSADLEHRIHFQVGDATALEFNDSTFDRCWSASLLCHLDDPAQALAEMVRVVRPGGRVVIQEPDFGTQGFDLPDRALTRKLLDFRTDSYKSGWAGRQLPRLCRAAGLVDLTIVPIAGHRTEYAPDTPGDLKPVIKRAVEAGAISADEGTRLLDDFDEAVATGNFLYAALVFGVAGTKPYAV